jgi:hypothetical protein
MKASNQGESDRRSTCCHTIQVTALTIVLLLGGVYAGLAVTAQDFLWFAHHFDRRPVHIVVYHHYGKQADLWPGLPGFDELSAAIQACLDQGVEEPSGMRFSDASLTDAYTRYVSVEAFFLQPVRLHAWFGAEQSARLLILLSHRESEMSLVVLGKRDRYLPNPAVLKTDAPLRETLQALGYRASGQ